MKEPELRHVLIEAIELIESLSWTCESDLDGLYAVPCPDRDGKLCAHCAALEQTKQWREVLNEEIPGADRNSQQLSHR